MDNAYRGIKEYKTTEEKLLKQEEMGKKTLKLWRDLTLSVTPSAYLLKIALFFK